MRGAWCGARSEERGEKLIQSEHSCKLFSEGNQDLGSTTRTRYASGPVFSRHVNVRPLISQIRDEITRPRPEMVFFAHPINKPHIKPNPTGIMTSGSRIHIGRISLQIEIGLSSNQVWFIPIQSSGGITRPPTCRQGFTFTKNFGR